jgi:hypothetical protein
MLIRQLLRIIAMWETKMYTLYDKTVKSWKNTNLYRGNKIFGFDNHFYLLDQNNTTLIHYKVIDDTLLIISYQLPVLSSGLSRKKFPMLWWSGGILEIKTKSPIAFR